MARARTMPPELGAPIKHALAAQVGDGLDIGIGRHHQMGLFRKQGGDDAQMAGGAAEGAFARHGGAIMSPSAKPESTAPQLTLRRLSAPPSLVRADRITPAGPHTVAVSQRPTPRGWLISPAIAWPTGK